ncbi:FAD-dependent oxidoreductase [Lacticaseibacillus jixiensis]|uniref:FAD-dependent oxidoreductase n=1 Tax=Lacticaseibacillus jixiensis TaxID=3231926 RepID=UPI0036F425C7
MNVLALVGESGAATLSQTVLDRLRALVPAHKIAADAPKLEAAITAADGLIVVVPEHEPGVLTALQQAIAALTQTKPLLAGMPTLLIGASATSMDSFRATKALAQTLAGHGVKAALCAQVELGDARRQAKMPQLKAAAAKLTAAMTQEDETMKQPQIAWDATYDVIVLGFGGAGATAARFAADNGAKVLLVDAAPNGHEGGNTRYAGQIVGSASDFDEMKQYYERLQYPLDLDEEMIDTYVDGMVGMSDYFQKYLGVAKPFSVRRDWTKTKPNLKTMLPEFPEYPGGEAYDVLLVHDGTFDSAFWKTLRQQVVDRADQIDVWFASPARHLLQDPTTKAVIGAQIEREHVLLNIQATNGVVLATGGFENNKQMIQDYLGAQALTPLGTVYNKGDGVAMAQEVGADMWHMHNYESLGLTVREPEGKRGKILFDWTAMTKGSAFVIGDDGTRYLNEAEENRHGHLYDHGTWRIPANNVHPYLIFDAKKYAAFEQASPAWLKQVIKAPNIADLAALLHVPAANLAKTQQRFDQFAKAGDDPQFDRDPQSMTAFDDGPYYALPLRQSMLNTQGGPRRNVRCEVLDPTGKPIPQLYSAGELGGISANQYQGGNNLAECLIFGKIAGMNAARPKHNVAVSAGQTAAASAAPDATSGASQHAAAASDLAGASEDYPTGPDQYIGRSTAGMGNEIVVRVTYKDHTIENVEVLKQNESGDFGLKAIQALPQAMVAKNSPDVDAVTGASVSSSALKEAVKDALRQAK